MSRRLCLAWFLCCSSASAASISWEPGPGAESCAAAGSFQRDLEARLGRPLTAIAEAPQALRVSIERTGRTFIARIELRNEHGTLVGERTLSVQGQRCEAIEPYLSLAVALMIDPEAGLGELDAPSNPRPPSEPVRAPLETPPSTPVQPSPTAPAPGTSPARTGARVSGSGQRVVYVYPPLRPEETAGRVSSRQASSVALTQLAQRLLGQRLLEREIYTVVQPPALFDDAIRAEARRRRALNEPPPRAISDSGAPAPAPDYLLQPTVVSLVVQDGIDYSRGNQLPLVTATIALSVAGVDYVRRQELEPFEASATISVEGSRHDPRASGFAVRLALSKAVENLLLAMRREDAFRIRPRWAPTAAGAGMALPSLRGVTNGDRFQFEGPDGARSGFVVARDVQANRARLEIWKTGNGARLVDIGQDSPGAFEVSVRSVRRLGYGDPSDAERARALRESRAPRQLGSVTELGLDTRYYFEPDSGSGFRPFTATNFSFMKSSSLALNIGVQGGIGYELAALPVLGLSLLPFVAVGPLLTRGKLGSSDAPSVPLDGFFGASGAAGVRLEFYRLFGDLSLAATAQAEYVAALYSRTPRSGYLDDRYPDLHSLTFQLGCVYRPSDYPD